MTKYEYEIEPKNKITNSIGVWVNTSDNRIDISTYDNVEAVSLSIINKRGQEGWIYSGTDPMGNMVFRREIMES